MSRAHGCAGATMPTIPTVRKTHLKSGNVIPANAGTSKRSRNVEQIIRAESLYQEQMDPGSSPG